MYDAPLDEQLELFLEGMMREVRETVGGLVTWMGFIGDMRLTLDGVTYTRSLLDRANAVRCIYTRLGDNQFTNGSAESGAWTAYNSPTTLAQSTTWASDGDNSCHIVGDSANDGATIQGGITVVAAKPYEARVSVNLVSGTWKLEIYREDTGASLGSTTEATAGQRVMRATISDTNTFAGTVGVRLYHTTAAGEIYGDGAVFQEGPQRAETSWYHDTASQDEYGRIEDVLLEGGMSDAAANAKAQTELAKRAWPRTLPPRQSREGAALADGLELTVYGYAFTLRNRYTERTGTDAASDHVTNVVTDSEFVSTGVIETNSLDFKIDERGPLRVWEILREIALAGDASGNRWVCGVTGRRVFDYQAAETVLAYHYRGGQLLNPASGLMEPWFALPGLARIDEMPVGPGDISGDEADDPRVIYLEEVEFDAAQWLSGETGLSFKLEAGL